ncbi:MAG: hypothetical protein ACKO9V_10560, partial [Candidatus Kapaibacterium sp.]
LAMRLQQVAAPYRIEPAQNTQVMTGRKKNDVHRHGRIFAQRIVRHVSFTTLRNRICLCP